jgi:transposase
MAKVPMFEEGTKEKMGILMKERLSGGELRRVQSILLGACGTSSLVISEIVGYSPEYVRSLWQKYRREGEKSLLGERRGQGRGRAHLTMEEEEKFLAPFIEKAKGSGVLIVSEIHEALKRRLGKEKMQNSITYRLLHRHGWRKIVPRPFHPKANKESQEAFRDSFPPNGTKIKKEGKEKKSQL